MKLLQTESDQKKAAGFTLIEILLAIGILAFGLLALASMQVMSIQTNGKANRITEGATMAMNQLEQLMTQGYDSFSDTGSVKTQLYDLSWEVKAKDEDKDYQTKHVVITVKPLLMLTSQKDIVLDGFVSKGFERE